MVLPTSQPTVDVAPTAAVAWVPREPTMAVSMYCTAVPMSCSSMVGQARERIVGSSSQGSFLFKEGFIITSISIEEIFINAAVILSEHRESKDLGTDLSAKGNQMRRFLDAASPCSE